MTYRTWQSLAEPGTERAENTGALSERIHSSLKPQYADLGATGNFFYRL